MTKLIRHRHQTQPTGPGRRSSRIRPAARRRGLSLELISEAVVAGYIHDISARHGHVSEREVGAAQSALAALRAA